MMDSLVCSRNIASVGHIVPGVSDVQTLLRILIYLEILLILFGNDMSQIHVHEIHSPVTVDIYRKAFLPGGTEFVSVFLRHSPCRHIAEQLISQPLSVNKFRSCHIFFLSFLSAKFPTGYRDAVWGLSNAPLR